MNKRRVRLFKFPSATRCYQVLYSLVAICWFTCHSLLIHVLSVCSSIYPIPPRNRCGFNANAALTANCDYRAFELSIYLCIRSTYISSTEFILEEPPVHQQRHKYSSEKRRNSLRFNSRYNFIHLIHPGVKHRFLIASQLVCHYHTF